MSRNPEQPSGGKGRGEGGGGGAGGEGGGGQVVEEQAGDGAQRSGEEVDSLLDLIICVSPPFAGVRLLQKFSSSGLSDVFLADH